MGKSIVLFESENGIVNLPVCIDTERNEVWLTRRHLAELFDCDVKTIGKQINNALREELEGSCDRVVARFATTASDSKTYQTEH